MAMDTVCAVTDGDGLITSPARTSAISLSVSLSCCNVYNVDNVANVVNLC